MLRKNMTLRCEKNYNQVPAGDTPVSDHDTKSIAIKDATALLLPPAIPAALAALKLTVPTGGITVPAVTKGATPGSKSITPAPAMSDKLIKSIKLGAPAGGLIVPPAVKSTLKIGVMTVDSDSGVNACTGGAWTVNNQLAKVLDQLSAIAVAPPVGGLSIMSWMSEIKFLVFASGIILF